MHRRYEFRCFDKGFLKKVEKASGVKLPKIVVDTCLESAFTLNGIE